VRRLLPACIAEFLRFQPLGMLLLVFRRRVVAVLAIAALQRNDLAHRFSVLVRQALGSNFTNNHIHGQNVFPSDQKQVPPPILIVQTDPETVIARLLHIESDRRRIG